MNIVLVPVAMQYATLNSKINFIALVYYMSTIDAACVYWQGCCLIRRCKLGCHSNYDWYLRVLMVWRGWFHSKNYLIVFRHVIDREYWMALYTTCNVFFVYKAQQKEAEKLIKWYQTLYATQMHHTPTIEFVTFWSYEHYTIPYVVQAIITIIKFKPFSMPCLQFLPADSKAIW